MAEPTAPSFSPTARLSRWDFKLQRLTSLLSLPWRVILATRAVSHSPRRFHAKHKSTPADFAAGAPLLGLSPSEAERGSGPRTERSHGGYPHDTGSIDLPARLDLQIRVKK